MKLIDKDALVAEIEKLIDELYQGQPFDSLSREKQVALWYVKSIMSSVNTLEVKEVDLDVMQRMEECPYRQVGCTIYEGKILECKGACSWVVDYQKLKELKAQKGE